VLLDRRLHQILALCDPALDPEQQVALTLHAVCGLTIEEVARAFLLPATTMARRLATAQARLRAARQGLTPAEDGLADRLAAVMTTLYLVFNEGYAAASGPSLVRAELCREAIRLTRLLRSLMTEPPPELDALLALMLLHDARRAARVDAGGELVPLADQDRARWDRDQIDEARALLSAALRRAPPGPLALQAAIAALHAQAASVQATDWRQIAALYRRLVAQEPSAVAALNGAVAVAMAEGALAGLRLVDELAETLGDYHLWHATRADLLHKLGRSDEAAASYRRALALATNEVERRFLQRRLTELAGDS
jgi:RNA polymerase sigma-70 factor (ECF subfamily)